MTHPPATRPNAAEPRQPAEAPVALRVSGLGKCYRLYSRPLDRLKQALARSRRTYYREFWALRSVSLAVRRGETVGIMGRNGCGKSTLLQLVCGTLAPTEGRIETCGRIAALLELGAGFNPEFTGRDNVITNAAVLGLSDREIRARFDQIVAFAEMEDFIDQPVKTYSSGMYVRLAFAVAISVEPEILVVDEALGVGDEAFQRKCYARIRNIQQGGGTILFVSHDAAAVLELCSRAVLLDGGEVVLEGDPKTVVTRYHKLLYCPAERREAVRREIRQPAADQPAGADGPQPAPDADTAYLDPHMRSRSAVCYEPHGAEIVDPHIATPDGRRVNVLVPDREYLICYRVRFAAPAFSVRFGSMIKTLRGVELTTMAAPRGGREMVAAGSEICVRFRFRCLLTADTYFANVGVYGVAGGRESYLHRITDALMFRVVAGSQRATGGAVDLYADVQMETQACTQEVAA